MATPLDELNEYKHEVMKAITSSQKVLGLMADDPDIDMDSSEVYDLIDHNFYDYSFSDSTFQEDRVVVFVEAVMQRRPSVAFKGMKVMVQIICNKGYVKLDGKKFKGVLGNRRDNLACEIANTLEGSDEFGIGDLQLTLCEPLSVPDGFTGVGLEFDDVNFMRGDHFAY